mmetsp:Transcript_44064/g.106236  ORF Transcript_44064/g.106236 Transcript_44064/m.106236 type:complete len:117 (-) Transcript_44064:374-724(-)
MTTSIPLILSKDYTGQKIEIEIKEELVGHCQDSFILIGATSHRIESVSPLATPLVGITGDFSRMETSLPATESPSSMNDYNKFGPCVAIATWFHELMARPQQFPELCYHLPENESS